jgi:hypothetical protein
MAKSTAKIARTTVGGGTPKEETVSITLPRLDDTKNYAKFGLEKNGGDSPFGTWYLPLAAADGVSSVTLTYVGKKGGR